MLRHATRLRVGGALELQAGDRRRVGAADPFTPRFAAPRFAGAAACVQLQGLLTQGARVRIFAHCVQDVRHGVEEVRLVRVVVAIQLPAQLLRFLEQLVARL